MEQLGAGFGKMTLKICKLRIFLFLIAVVPLNIEQKGVLQRSTLSNFGKQHLFLVHKCTMLYVRGV